MNIQAAKLIRGKMNNTEKCWLTVFKLKPIKCACRSQLEVLRTKNMEIKDNNKYLILDVIDGAEIIEVQGIYGIKNEVVISPGSYPREELSWETLVKMVGNHEYNLMAKKEIKKCTGIPKQ